jgi:hypothetical protein
VPHAPSNQEGWTHSDQLILPRQSLSKEEAEPFLSYVFSQMARKPKRLRLRETARVARYIKAIAAEMPGSWERATLDNLAKVTWLTLLEVGQIPIGTKSEAIGFLREHAHTYLASFEVDKLIEQIDKSVEPSRYRELFQPPKLMGKSRSVQGGGPRLQDDLTERIYVGYHALRRAEVRNARCRIAAVLNELGLKTRAQSGTAEIWASQEVFERVQQFEDRIVRKHRLARLAPDDRIKEIARLRNMLVDSWIHEFRFALAVESRARPSVKDG